MELGCDYGDLGFDPGPKPVLVPDPSQEEKSASKMSSSLLTRPAYSFKTSGEGVWRVNIESSPLSDTLSTIPSLG